MLELKYEPIPYTNHTYYLYNNRVYDKHYNEIPRKNINGVFMVEFNWFNGKKMYDLRLVIILTYYKPDYPHYVLKNIVARNKGGKYSIYREEIFYDFLHKPIEHKEAKGFYWIPYYSKYLINKKLEIFNIKTGNKSKYFITKPDTKKNITGGYYKTSMMNDRGIGGSAFRHRIVAYTHIDIPDHPRYMFVNHINGKPGEDNFNNLEWVTPKQNLEHALRNNLMPNSVRKIDYWNVNTNERIKFDSISNASRFLNISIGLISNRLSKIQTIYPDGKLFKYHEDEWLPLNEMRVIRSGSKIPVIAVNIITNEEKKYDNIMQASNDLNISTTTISDYMKGRINKPVKQKYIFKTQLE